MTTFRASEAFADPVCIEDEDSMLVIHSASSVGEIAYPIEIAAGVTGPKLDLAGVGVFGSQVDMVNKLAAGLIGPKLYPLSALVDLDQLAESFSALASADRASGGLDREQIRQLWGQYIYVQVGSG